MANGVPYLIDSNAFIDIGERFYPDDVFSCVWSAFSGELVNASAVTIRLVLSELQRPSPIPAWRPPVVANCKPHAIDEGDPAIQVIYSRLAPMAQPGGALPGGLSDTDLFIMAAAERNQMPIVTRDREIRISCERGLVNTRAIEPAQYFREKGWVFR